jgi:hypothetical protein
LAACCSRRADVDVAFQVEDGRSAAVDFEDRWRNANPAGSAGRSLATTHTRLADCDRAANTGHDLALRQMAMAHYVLAAIPGLEINSLGRKSATFASTARASRGRAPCRKISVS